MNNRNYNSNSNNNNNNSYGGNGGGQPRTKLRCSGCSKTKSLESFSKRQRREKDNARCMACVQKDLGESDSD